MYHTEAIFKLIKETDNVLDIGGGAEPFLRANSVIDIQPYEWMKTHTSYKGTKQHFSKESWFQQDICDVNLPWPFKDKEFDFSVAGHVMEDIKNPIRAIKEMVRVSKKGYVEIPSRFLEQTIDLELPGLCGFSHHNWVIDVYDGKIRCIAKTKEMSSNKSHHISKRGSWPHLNKNFCSTGIFWEGNIEAFEILESVSSEAINKYYSETLELIKQIPESELYNTSVSVINSVKYPFKDDGTPHIKILFEHTPVKISDEEFWNNV